jgi:hypothetical protein
MQYSYAVIIAACRFFDEVNALTRMADDLAATKSRPDPD